MNFCKCRNCEQKYDESKSRADYKGFCTQRCMLDTAKKHGYRTATRMRRSVYEVLKAKNQIGSVPWNVTA